MVNKNVLSCLLKDDKKDGKEVNAVMLVGRQFDARATVSPAASKYRVSKMISERRS